MPKELTPRERAWVRYRAESLKHMRSHRNLRKRDFLAGFDAAEKLRSFIATAENLVALLDSMSPEVRKFFLVTNGDEVTKLRDFLKGDHDG